MLLSEIVFIQTSKCTVCVMVQMQLSDSGPELGQMRAAEMLLHLQHSYSAKWVIHLRITEA